MSEKYPPGPKSFLGLSIARQMQRDVFSFSMDLARQYGDSATFRIGPVRFFQFTHPDQIHDVLVRQAKKFLKPRRVKQVLGKWDGQGLVLSDGELWIRQRRLVQQAFHPRRVQGYARDMVAITQQMFARWQQLTTIDAIEEMHRVTLEIVGKTLFGFAAADHSGIRQAVQDLQDTGLLEFGRLVPLPDWLPIASKRRMRAAIGYMNRLISSIIDQRRATGEDAGDLLSMLLLAVDAEGDGRGMSNQQARDEAMTLLLAGHETTATSLVWTLYLLAAHPEIQDATAQSVQELLGDALPTADDVPRLALVEQAIKESMRMYPAVYFTSREAAEEVDIAGCPIAPGNQVHLLIYAAHHDPRWHEAPEEFRPARFTPENEARLPPGAYVPFGAGPRNCIGKSMAMTEAILIVASILQRYRLTLAPGQGQPELVAQISLHPRGALRLSLEPRGPVIPGGGQDARLNQTLESKLNRA